MDSERWLKVKAILNQLAEVTEERRPQMLLELVGDDDQLRLEVEGYFEVEEEADSFLDQPLWKFLDDGSDLLDNSTSQTAQARLQTQTGPPSGVFSSAEDITRIGPYRLQGLLGQGGMAQVHLAVREDDYQQEVALKRVLGPVDRPQLRERFVNERQILANLQHPGIARLLDGGTDEKGFPFLVMEYVEGEPIDAYCQDHDLSINARLRLFGQVCRAVHHAHQNLVVHRDLKPSNILVTSEGQVRLLDFGIAKLLAGTEDMQLTDEGQAPMTPAYASPEQMMGESVTTGSDVYALGVLLYCLLTEKKPYDLQGRNFAALARKICFDDPELPSLKVIAEPVQDASENRAAQRLSRQLNGDLDAIVMKAMRKEPSQRYPSAAELDADISHYLEGAPVRAHDGNWVYHTVKYLRRNRPAVAILALIITLAITSTGLWRRAELRRSEATAAQQQAELSRDEAQTLSDFLTTMLRSADPEHNRGTDLTVREVVDVARQDVETELAGRPKTQAIMLATLGGVYDGLGLYAQGLELAEQALAKETESTSEPTFDWTVRLGQLGRSRYNIGDTVGAERIYQQALAARRMLDLPQRDNITLMFNLAAAKTRLGKYDEAKSLHQKILDFRLTTPGIHKESIGSSFYGLASVCLMTEAYDEAIPLLEQALSYRGGAQESDQNGVAEVLAALSDAHLGLGQAEKALDYIQQALTIHRSNLGEQHTQVAAAHKLLAEAHLQLGRLDRAASEIERALAILKHPTTNNRDYWGLADAEGVLGWIKIQQGQIREGKKLLAASHDALQARLGTEDHRTRKARKRLESTTGR